jgi:hypothetical protein
LHKFIHNLLKALLDARNKELKTEEHLVSIAEREKGRLNQENQRLQKEFAKLKEKRNTHEVIYIYLEFDFFFFDFNLI